MDKRKVKEMLENKVKIIGKGISMLDPDLAAMLKPLVDNLSREVYVELKEQVLRRQ